MKYGCTVAFMDPFDVLGKATVVPKSKTEAARGHCYQYSIKPCESNVFRKHGVLLRAFARK
jgi:hypothetical protein